MARGGFLVCILLLVGACDSPPKAHDFKNTWEMSQAFDHVWEAVIEVFAEHNWTILNMEKDSGLIASDWHSLPPKQEYADCGVTWGWTYGEEVRFNVFVRHKGAHVTLQVNARFRQNRGQHGYAECTSTGKLEAEVHDMVVAKLQ